MLEIKIEKVKVSGYQDACFKWHCPMCHFKLELDLVKEYVETEAQQHVIHMHWVMEALIKTTFVEGGEA